MYETQKSMIQYTIISKVNVPRARVCAYSRCFARPQAARLGRLEARLATAAAADAGAAAGSAATPEASTGSSVMDRLSKLERKVNTHMSWGTDPFLGSTVTATCKNRTQRWWPNPRGAGQGPPQSTVCHSLSDSAHTCSRPPQVQARSLNASRR